MSQGNFYLRINPFLPTVPTFAVRETDVSRHNGGASDAPHKALRDDSALRTLSSLRGLRGAIMKDLYPSHLMPGAHLGSHH